jgi:hypothetical protein
MRRPRTRREWPDPAIGRSRHCDRALHAGARRKGIVAVADAPDRVPSKRIVPRPAVGGRAVRQQKRPGVRSRLQGVKPNRSSANADGALANRAGSIPIDGGRAVAPRASGCEEKSIAWLLLPCWLHKPGRRRRAKPGRAAAISHAPDRLRRARSTEMAKPPSESSPGHSEIVSIRASW